MELWIRSQDRTDLVKVNALWVIENQIWMEVPFYENHKKIGLTITGHNHKLAEYKTKERALEVLDIIENKIRGKFLLKPKNILKPSTIVDAKYYFESLNKIELITVDNNFDILPISDGVIIYEMPEE